jgi:hypothetical protein
LEAVAAGGKKGGTARGKEEIEEEAKEAKKK